MLPLDQWDPKFDFLGILDYVALICESFYTIFFISVPLGCNKAILTLTSVAKENEKVVVWLEEYPFFVFSLYNMNMNEFNNYCFLVIYIYIVTYKHKQFSSLKNIKQIKNHKQ